MENNNTSLVILLLIGFLTLSSLSLGITIALDAQEHPYDINTVQETAIIDEYPITAMNDRLGISGKINGSILYASGKIDSVAYYQVLEDHGDYIATGVYEAKYVKLCPIKDDEAPSIEIVSAEIPGRWIAEKTKEIYRLNIPESSITNTVTVDLEG